jgi:hypothetical protein
MTISIKRAGSAETGSAVFAGPRCTTTGTKCVEYDAGPVNRPAEIACHLNNTFIKISLGRGDGANYVHNPHTGFCT